MDLEAHEVALRGGVVGLVGAHGVEARAPARARAALVREAGGLDGDRVEQQDVAAEVDEVGDRAVDAVGEGAEAPAAAVEARAVTAVRE